MFGSASPFLEQLPPSDGQLLSKIKDQWDSTDIVFGNVEGVLTDDLSSIRECLSTSSAVSASPYRRATPAF